MIFNFNYFIIQIHGKCNTKLIIHFQGIDSSLLVQFFLENKLVRGKRDCDRKKVLSLNKLKLKGDATSYKILN